MSHEHIEHETYEKTVFGFWIYLLTDFVLFATILATYFVLRNSLYGGPSAADVLPLEDALTQTLLLLMCSFTSGLAGVFSFRKYIKTAGFLLGLTAILGFCFMWIEYEGFDSLIKQGFGWHASAFLSAYFTLIGTHGVHILFALLWTVVFLPQLLSQGMTWRNLQRMTCLRLFWQFLGLIWVGIFTMVYLMGVS
jgi:cytochrome o ubiquinol oxidase subunit 3